MNMEKIYAATIPWFEPYTFGLLWGSDDPHKARAIFLSQPDDETEIQSEADFVHHVLKMQNDVKALEEKLCEQEHTIHRLNTGIDTEIKTRKFIQEKLEIATEALEGIENATDSHAVTRNDDINKICNEALEKLK
jgi:uncharacterized coiled-coil protein SlyX